MDKITPCLWFDFNAEEAVNFYLTLFPNSRVTHTAHYGPEIPAHAGRVLLIEFELNGQSYQALNAGPQHTFSEAISLSVCCADQAEVDKLWLALTRDGGQSMDCSWVKDKFGLSWQLVPADWWTMMRSQDKAAVSRAFSAMLTMQKLDLAALKRAFDGA